MFDSDLMAAVRDLAESLAQQQPFDVSATKIQPIFEEGQGATLKECNEALPHLARLIHDAENDMMAAYIAIASGALVERGADPTIAADAILERLELVAEGALDFYNACLQADAFIEDADSENIMKTIAAEMPLSAFQWSVLERVYVAPIALLSRSKALRQQVKTRRRLVELIAAMSRDNVGAGWLEKMFAVLDDEALLVLHPEQGKGYRITIEGIASNFDLHTLLSAALIGDPAEGWLEGNAPDPDVVEALQGEAPASPMHTTGSFNLVNYTGLQDDGTVSQDMDSRAHWIWNEGIPADITPFEGLRVILLTPPPYVRTWNVGRTFGGMIGRLYVQQVLSADEVKGWLRRLRRS
jgi:hypothetical protein